MRGKRKGIGMAGMFPRINCSTWEGGGGGGGCNWNQRLTIQTPTTIFSSVHVDWMPLCHSTKHNT